MDNIGRMGARRIYEALKDQIEGRVYGVDGPLPSSRSLADELGVARSTVTAAYDQLAAEGFIETRHGARPRVARAVVHPPERVAARSSARSVPLSAFGERLRKNPLGMDRTAARPRRELPVRRLVTSRLSGTRLEEGDRRRRYATARPVGLRRSVRLPTAPDGIAGLLVAVAERTM